MLGVLACMFPSIVFVVTRYLDAEIEKGEMIVLGENSRDEISWMIMRR